ncbi:serine/threonine-protein kinase [Streptomyces sp. NPDC096012]|uniref:serine/threonine-protein kinase n=1 Tax=Streptomyces sp. NPDC096012 TaxID=3155684 RepID=UPI00336A59BA
MPEWTGPSGTPGSAATTGGAAPAPSLPPGFVALRRIGRPGRHATVLLCREEATGAEVAVKVLDITVDDERRRLAAHSELLSAGAAAQYPCAVSVEDAGFTPDHHPYVVEQFCPGGDAQARLTASGPFPIDDVVIIGTRLALALHSGHRRGVLHLGVRPSNVLFDAGGDALLADHGIARVLQRSAPRLGAIFDPMYASRELFGWENPGPAADVYSLGATLYALLNGEPAHLEAGRAGSSALYEAVFHGELPPPAQLTGVPGPLLTLIHRMMSPNPEGRPPLTEVHRVLRTVLPLAQAARVPALEPEPAPVAPLPGWDPADDVTAEEAEAAEQAGSAARDEARRQSRRRLIAVCTAVTVFAASATAITLLLNGTDKGAAHTGASPSPTAPQQVPQNLLAGLMPRKVTVTKAEGNVEVTWQVPQQAGQVTGYVVRAKVPGVKDPVLKTADGTEPAVVFPAGSVPSGTCYTVTSLIIVSGRTEFASAPAVCRVGAS